MFEQPLQHHSKNHDVAYEPYNVIVNLFPEPSAPALFPLSHIHACVG